jgi:hypothetical protein
VLQFITALSFSSSLFIMCILFLFFFLGVLGGWWRRGGELVAYRWEWVDGLVAPVTRSLPLYTFFHFWGGEADGGRGFSFPLSALTAHGLFPSFLLSLPF